MKVTGRAANWMASTLRAMGALRYPIPRRNGSNLYNETNNSLKTHVTPPPHRHKPLKPHTPSTSHNSMTLFL